MRKYLVSTVAAIALVAVASPAMAAGPINGTGTVSCTTVTGSASFKPGLGSGGGLLPYTNTTKSASSTCTGTGNGANVVSGASSGGTTGATNSCGNLASPTTTIALVTKWKSAPKTAKLNSSNVQFSTITVDSTAPISFTLHGTVTSGSFTGTTVAASVVTNATVGSFLAGCASKAGFKKFTLVSGSNTLS